MLLKIATLIASLGCLILLVLIFLVQYTQFPIQPLKPVLWITVGALIIRLVLRIKKK